MSTRKTVEEREFQINKSCDSRGFSFVKWVDGYTNAYSKVICRCHTHGEWAVSVHNLVNGGRGCPGCQKVKTSIRCLRPESEAIAMINRKRHGFIFSGWQDGYAGSKSKFYCKCPAHGNWVVSFIHYVHGNTGCPSCSGLKPYSKSEREMQIRSCCLNSGLEFIGWAGLYSNSNSRFIYECQEHGKNEVSVNTFINQGTRCPGCAESGFNKESTAGLYALISEDRKIVKVGISNNPQSRIKNLTAKTPLPFQCIGVHSGHGRDILSLERHFHSKYYRAGLTGFDGSTEWLKVSDELIAELNEVFHV